MRLLILGPGYSAQAAVARLQEQAETITATARSAEKAEALEARGIEPVRLDDAGSALADATHLLVSIPPGEDGDPGLDAVRGHLASARHLASIAYFSTVGVYGDHGGAWVDETGETRPKSKRSIARVAAEEAWREAASGAGKPLAILRLSGIYGPGRNALANLRAGTARRIVKPGQVFNRIHVEDIAAATVAAFERHLDGTINVTDDEPAPPQDVVAFAAQLLGVEPPPEIAFEEADLSPMARSFYGENKRVRNARAKSELGLSFAYPTYREGLRALLEAGEGGD